MAHTHAKPMEAMDLVFADRATVPCFIGSDCQAEIVSRLRQMKPKKFFVVLDESVNGLHGDFLESLRGSRGESGGETGADEEVEVLTRVLPNGDACKSWDNLKCLIDWLFSSGAAKKDVIVGFGGGAVMNVTGLFASISYRGLRLAYVPTSFLAMHDVTTSLKTSICFDGRKNNIGTYYAPQLVLIDAAFCRTLPRLELFSGLGELAKNAALLGADHAGIFVEVLSKDLTDARNGGSGEEFTLDDDSIMRLIKLGCEAKMSVLLTDAYEKMSGMIFEYGHTVSHAIEKAYGDGVIPHGLGVTYGMLCCSFTAQRLGIMSEEDREFHDKICTLLVSRWPLPEPRPSIDRIMERAMKDSKRGITEEASNELSEVLLECVGTCVKTPSMLSKFDKVHMEEWLETMGFSWREKGECPVPDEAVSESHDAENINPLVPGVVQEALAALRPAAVKESTVSLSGGFTADLYVTPGSPGTPSIVTKVLSRSQAAMQLATTPLKIFEKYEQAHKLGVGPAVHGLHGTCLVMDLAEGHHPVVGDLDNPATMDAFAGVLRKFHTSGPIDHPTPLVWKWLACMSSYVLCDDENPLHGDDADFADEVCAEVNSLKATLKRMDLVLVYAHGNFKPANIVVSDLDPARVMLIDFDTSGCNYRGYDLVKFFRKDEPYSAEHFESFLRAYSQGEFDVEVLRREAAACEGLSYLEPALFFLFLATKDPDNRNVWMEKAHFRWNQYQQTLQ